jgi:hypothetical protein
VALKVDCGVAREDADAGRVQMKREKQFDASAS